MTFNQFRLIWQSKDLYSDVIGEKNIIYLKTFSAKKNQTKNQQKLKLKCRILLVVLK